MTEKRRHILFLASWYPNRHAPDLGIFIRRHAQTAALIDNVSVVSARSDESITEPELDLGSLEDVTEAVVYYPKVKSSIPLISEARKLARYRQAMRTGIEAVIAKNGKPDLIHLHVIFPAAIAALSLLRKMDVPMLITEHWSGYLSEDGNYKGRFMKAITQKAVQASGVVTAVSEKMINAMLEHGLQADYRRLNNVVDTHFFVPPHGEKKSGPLRLLHVSSLVDREKNISGMLRVADKLTASGFEYEFHIVGGSAEDVAQYPKTNPNVHFHGRKNPQELLQFYQQSDVLILFSHFEGMPVVIAEAQACGLPVIATSVGAIPEMISEYYGALVAPGDERALENVIRSFAEHRHEFSPFAIRERAVDAYGTDAVAERLQTLYDDLITG